MKHYTREQIEALINTMEIQRHNFSEQLTMTVGAIQALQHLLSLSLDDNETETSDGTDKNGDETA